MSQDESRLPAFEEAPWLIYSPGPNQTFCTMSPAPPNNNSYLKTSIPGLQNKAIYASCYNWLFLLSDVTEDGTWFSLWNSATFEKIDLPMLPHDEEFSPDYSTFVLTAPPDSLDSNNDCVVMLFYEKSGPIAFCRPLRDDNWVTKKVELDGEAARVDQATSLDGVVYAWVATKVGTSESQFNLARIEVASNDGFDTVTLRSLHIRKPIWDLPYSGCKDFLVTSCGRIYCVSVLNRGLLYRPYCVVKVFEIDLQEKTCKDIDCLQGRAFFIGRNGCTWCWGSTDPADTNKVAGNCIYFLHNENAVYSYSLHDQSFSFSYSCPGTGYPIGRPIWLMPRDERYSRVQAEMIMNRVFGRGGVTEPAITEPPRKKVAQVDQYFSELPAVLIDIVSTYLHLFDYWNFRASVKLSKSTFLPAPQWRTHNSYPLFMFLKNDYKQCQVMDPSRDDPVVFDLSCKPCSIEYSKDGWLIISTSNSLQLYNLFTKEKRDLPLYGDISVEWIHSIGFSTNPSSPDCLIVAAHASAKGTEFLYIKPGDSEWKCCYFEHGTIRFDIEKSSPVYYQEAFYFMDPYGNIGQFSLIDGGGLWQEFLIPRCVGLRLLSYNLVECHGKLYSVIFEYWGSWVSVFKYNPLEDMWFSVKNLKNRVLFVSNTSCSSMLATSPETGNRIYLPRFKGNNLVFYSLATQKFHVVGQEDASVMLCDTKEPLNCCWV